MQEHTTKFNMTLAYATEVANAWTKGQSFYGTDYTKHPYNWRKEYNTAIKGESEDSRFPEYCWAVSNRYDPRVAKGE